MMPRIKIELPATRLMQPTIPVRITDINYGNHVGNDSLVSILHEARMQWLTKHNFSELNVGGTGLIQSDLSIEYVAESFYGDVLAITIFAGEISRVGFELFYCIECSRESKNIIIAKAKTGMLCYDYINKRVVSVPVPLTEILKPS